MKTPQQLIQQEIDRLTEQGYDPQDARNEIRTAGIEAPNLWHLAPSSRNFEVDIHCQKIYNKWIAYPYYSGGGKHGYPEEMEWVGHAFFVDCKEEEVVTIKCTFSEIKDANNK